LWRTGTATDRFRSAWISEATVRTHMSSTLAKLNLSSRTQAALYAVREGLVPVHSTTVAVDA
jgi:DNA-binding CsgD family transcriptional regulator